MFYVACKLAIGINSSSSNNINETDNGCGTIEVLFSIYKLWYTTNEKNMCKTKSKNGLLFYVAVDVVWT